MSVKDRLDIKQLPEHMAIIMDGNGRWAKGKGFLRAIGHENGVSALRKTATECASIGIPYLTVYAFSSENWNRPKKEVDTLMTLLVSSLKKELKTLAKNNIRLSAIGNLQALPKKCLKELTEVMEQTKHHDRMTLTLALSYGSQDEIITATKAIAQQVADGKLAVNQIDQNIFSNNLFTAGMPAVDLLIRTSGEYRISNFLLWQIAYAELVFCPVLWPEFNENELHKVLLEFQQRERRFGKTSEQINS